MPTQQRNLPEMEEDIQDLPRKPILVKFIPQNLELDTPDFSLVKSKSNFCFPRNQNKSLECLIKSLQNKASRRKIWKISTIFQIANGKIFQI